MTSVDLALVAEVCKRREFATGEIVAEGGKPVTSAFVVSSGVVFQRESDVSEASLDLNITAGADEVQTVGMLGLHSAKSVHPGSAWASTAVVAYEIDAQQYRRLLQEHPEVAVRVIESISDHTRRWDAIPRTALLAQQSRRAPAPIVALAAVLEAGYRHLLDSLLAHRTHNVFPDFIPPHAPTPGTATTEGAARRLSAAAGRVASTAAGRACFVFGAKRLRELFEYSGQGEPLSLQVASAAAPGVLLAPFSGFLEARQVMAHSHGTPYWSHGFVCRSMRDGLFAFGLNQVSEFFEERCPAEWEPWTRCVLGSALAGGVVGYCSHVPHMLSTMKLAAPAASYGDIFRRMVREAEDRLPHHFPPRSTRAVATFNAIFAPAGVSIRSMQLMGTCALVNGLLYAG
eukprot:Hpha_TRINITY_DN15501_c1_g1::TRINITY_DN15501_c1_g1_i1::g.105507::m.105507